MVIENMPLSEKRDLLFEQLSTLSTVVALPEPRGLFVSINIDRDMVRMIEEGAQLGWLFSIAGVLRLEVSENIDFSRDLDARQALQQLKARGAASFLTTSAPVSPIWTRSIPACLMQSKWTNVFLGTKRKIYFSRADVKYSALLLFEYYYGRSRK